MILSVTGKEFLPSRKIVRPKPSKRKFKEPSKTGFVAEISEELTEGNTDYRRVVYTSKTTLRPDGD